MLVTPRVRQLNQQDHDYRESLLVWREDKRAAVPRRRRPGCIGYDLCILNPCKVIPGLMTTADTGLVVRIPVGHYGRVAPHPDAIRMGIDVIGTVVDPDNRCALEIILINRSASIENLSCGSIVAQLVIERASQVDVFEAVAGVDQLDVRRERQIDREDRSLQA